MAEQFPNDLEVTLDSTWPRPLPTDDQLKDVFFNELGRSSTHTPENHLDRVRQIAYKGQVFTNLSHDLHRLLSVQGYYNRSGLSGRDVVRSTPDVLPLVKHMGIDNHLDVRKGVLIAVRPLMAEVLSGNDDAQSKLDTTALTMGLIVGESQSLSDGNTRVARAVHDYIKGGLDELEVSRVSDAERNFSVPKPIEELVMMQSLTQLVEHPDDPVLDGGVSMVSDKTMDLYMNAAATLQSIWQLNGEEGSEARLALIDRIETRLDTSDKDLAARARTILSQKSYAAAAVAAAFGNAGLPAHLNEAAMRRLVEANIDLMKMRTLGLAVGMARRGMFMSIERDEYSNAPTLTHKYWQPTDI